MKRIYRKSLILMIILLSLLLFGCEKKEQSIKIAGKNGEEICSISIISEDRKEFAGNENAAYLEEVISECENIIAEKNACDIKEARKILLKKGCSVYTFFDEKAYSAIKESYLANGGEMQFSFGASAVDTEGRLLAVYSGGSGANNAMQKKAPYSSFKPLAVYAPLIEKNMISWSSVYEDSPIKKVVNAEGIGIDWPQNATKTYLGKEVTIAEGIKKSLNTVAVRAMQELGVQNSLDFLEEKFGLALDFEKRKMLSAGEEEVIGNVALGYLYDGASAIDMSGYYEAFANGGYYIKPYAVSKICDENGDIIYEAAPLKNKIISDETYGIMNQLLQNTVTPGGTGEKAIKEQIRIGGKTGTGDYGNWFIGFTPQYILALWHGMELEENNCCKIFADAIDGFDIDINKKYPASPKLKKAAYCTESGKLISENCKRADMGYYSPENMPLKCDEH